MKQFIGLLIFAGAVYAAYYFGYPHLKPFLEEVIHEGEGEQEREVVAEPVLPAEGGAGSEPGKSGTPADPEKRPSAPVKTEEDRIVEGLYPMPEIQPLLELVDHWNGVPASAFPKDVVLRVAVEMELSSGGKVIGKSTTPPGATVSALALAGTQLTISPQGSDTIRGTVELDDTNFKEVLTELYQNFVERKTSEVLALRQAEKDRIVAQKKAAAELGKEWTSMGYTDGAAPEFAPVKASIDAGEAGDRELASAKRWRWLGPEWVKGTLYDAALVQFEVETMFGIFKSEVKALLQNGKVVRWVTPDTNEEVSY